MWRSERDIDGAIKGNVQDRPANRQNSTEVAPNHFRTPQRTSMESTNRASEAKAGTERKAFAARLHAVHSHRTLLKRPRRASSFFGRHCSPKGTSPTSRSYAFRYLAQHSVDGLSPQKERLATMICPISKRFLGHFFAPPQRPVWFRLPAKPIQLATSKASIRRSMLPNRRHVSPERLHRVRTLKNIDDWYNPRIHNYNSKWKCGVRAREGFLPISPLRCMVLSGEPERVKRVRLPLISRRVPSV